MFLSAFCSNQTEDLSPESTPKILRNLVFIEFSQQTSAQDHHRTKNLIPGRSTQKAWIYQVFGLEIPKNPAGPGKTWIGNHIEDKSQKMA